MKFFKNKLAVTASVLSVAFISLIGISVVKRDNIAIISQVKNVAYSVNGTLYGLSKSAKNAVIAIVNYNEIQKENEDLKKENSSLKGKLSGYDDLIKENGTLREAVDFKALRQEYNYKGADVLSYNTIGDPNVFTLNLGSKDGVYVNLAVMDPITESLIGTVSKVTENYCYVETVKHQNSKIAVKVKNVLDEEVKKDDDEQEEENNNNEEENNQEENNNQNEEEVAKEPEGTLNGFSSLNTTESDGEITLIPISANINIGDDVFTSGRGLLYPKDFPIGKVTNIIDVKGESMKRVEIKVLSDFDKLQQVVVIIPKAGIGEDGEVKYES